MIAIGFVVGCLVAMLVIAFVRESRNRQSLQERADSRQVEVWRQLTEQFKDELAAFEASLPPGAKITRYDDDGNPMR